MMDSISRRRFFVGGLAALGSVGLVLRSDAMPTEESGHPSDYSEITEFAPELPEVKVEGLKVTEDNILGPYFRSGAPFRAKITPPMEPGKVMVIRGRVWGFDTKKPLSGVVIDIWQANAKGRYDNDDPKNPPAKGVYLNRARLITDENGYYEFETIHPGPYQIGENSWRPCHIHYLVQATGYQRLVTQLYFKGDKYNATDEFIKESLIITLTEEKVNGVAVEFGTFDIVLDVAKKK
jgi:catechol 1,2-dioxygenase